jgi:acetyl esterase/lipase
MSDPQIAALRAQLANFPRSDDYQQIRKDFDALGLGFGRAADIAIETATANGVPAERTTTPNADRRAALLYLHGGGYVIGSLPGRPSSFQGRRPEPALVQPETRRTAAYFAPIGPGKI